MVKKRIILALALLALAVSQASAEGSWSQINQQVRQEADWVQIVKDRSRHQLGEEAPYGDGTSGLKTAKWGTYPSLDGSTVCVPMAMEFARQWLGLEEEDLKGFVSFSTTPNAYDRLITGSANPLVTILSRNVMMDDTHPVDIVIGTAPNQDEKDAAALAGAELVYEPVCYDAFVFFVNGQNPVKSLSREQIVEIYTGKWTEEDYFSGYLPQERNWLSYGGEDEPVIAYQRPHGSGSQTAMEEMVMKDAPLATQEDNYVTGGMAEIVQRIGNYENSRGALGYSYLYYLTSLYVNENIRVLAIDGVEPTPDNLRSGRYPYTVCYYAVYRAGNETAERFVNWMTTEEGQACIAQAGYVSLK